MSKRTVFVLGLLILVVAIFVIRGGKNGSAQTTGGTSGQCTVQVAADLLNVRSSPDGNAPVVQKIASGTTLAATKTMQGGYRELSANHWASSQFLKTVSGDC